MRCISDYVDSQSPRHIVLATHSELLYYPAHVFSNGKANFVDTGTYVSLERRDGKLVVTQANGITQGRDDVDIISAFGVDNPLMREGREAVYFK